MAKKLHLEQLLVPLDRLTHTPVDEDGWPREYKVRKVVGSTIPRVMCLLTEEQVKDYCESPDWVVEIT